MSVVGRPDLVDSLAVVNGTCCGIQDSTRLRNLLLLKHCGLLALADTSNLFLNLLLVQCLFIHDWGRVCSRMEVEARPLDIFLGQVEAGRSFEGLGALLADSRAIILLILSHKLDQVPQDNFLGVLIATTLTVVVDCAALVVPPVLDLVNLAMHLIGRAVARLERWLMTR